MKLKLISQILLGLSVTSIATLAWYQPSYGSQKFRCNTSGEVPTTDVLTKRGWEPIIFWQSDYFTISQEERCQIVTDRFQGYSDNQMMRYLTSRKNINGYPVLCIVDRIRGNCRQEDVVVTLEPGTDPGMVLQQITDLRRKAGAGVYLSGSKSSFYRDGDLYIDLNELFPEEN